jgi:hypothetical protein
MNCEYLVSNERADGRMKTHRKFPAHDAQITCRGFRKFLALSTLGFLLLLSLMSIHYTSRALDNIKETINIRLNMDKDEPHSHELLIPRNYWTRVTDSIFTYSAFLDLRLKRRDRRVLVRINGLWKIPPKDELRKKPIVWYHLKDETLICPASYYCRVYYENENGELNFVPGERLTRQIFEEGLKVYAGTFFNCYLNESLLEKVGESRGGLSVAIFPSNVPEYPPKLIPVRIIGKI